MNKLKYLRKLNLLSQNDVAKILLVKQSHYSLIESNQIKLNFQYLEILSDLYNVSKGYIINDSEDLLISKKDFFRLLEDFKTLDKYS